MSERDIPAEAIEALAKIIDTTERKGLPSGEPSWAHYIARAALEAAAPYIAAAAWDRAAASLVDDNGNPIKPTNATNPYRE